MEPHLIFLGNIIDGERMEIDFDAEEIRFVLLVGQTGSGKSVFHSHLYREFMRAYSPEELGFVFLDMTRSEFPEWDTRYLARPIVHDTEEALRTLEDIAESETDRKIVIHIEECDMVYRDRARMEAALDRLIAKENILVVYSTSRIDPEYLGDWMDRYADMKVVFAVSNEADSNFLVGTYRAARLLSPGDRIIVHGGRKIQFIPLAVS